MLYKSGKYVKKKNNNNNNQNEPFCQSLQSMDTNRTVKF